MGHAHRVGPTAALPIEIGSANDLPGLAINLDGSENGDLCAWKNVIVVMPSARMVKEVEGTFTTVLAIVCAFSLDAFTSALAQIAKSSQSPC